MKIHAEAVRADISKVKTFAELERIAEVTDVVADIALQETEHLMAQMQKLLADCALQACEGAVLAKRR